MEQIAKTRIDKWLWAVRLYKTRSLASEACMSGKVKINGNTAKPASMVQLLHEIQINRGAGEYSIFLVLKILEKRVGAPLAITCYEDKSPPKSIDGMPSAFFTFEKRDKGVGRPTKRERRDIDKFKGL